VAVPRPITPGLFRDSGDGPRLLAGHCAACTRSHFPATDVCPYCGEAPCELREVGPHATLFLFTTITSQPPGYRGPLPYGFGVVELVEGMRVVTRLTETDATRLRPGLPMRLVVEPLYTDEDGTPVVTYAFAPEPL
jgi:uncharacterized OB-fold protein